MAVRCLTGAVGVVNRPPQRLLVPHSTAQSYQAMWDNVQSLSRLMLSGCGSARHARMLSAAQEQLDKFDMELMVDLLDSRSQLKAARVPHKPLPSSSTATATATPTVVGRRVSSDKHQLQQLHENHGWVPGECHIRPSPEVLARKEQLMEEIEAAYVSVSDFALHRYLGLPAEPRDADGLLAVPAVLRRQAQAFGAAMLMENELPYDVPAGTHHSVMWYPSVAQLVPDETVTSDITKALQSHLAKTGHRT